MELYKLRYANDAHKWLERVVGMLAYRNLISCT